MSFLQVLTDALARDSAVLAATERAARDLRARLNAEQAALQPDSGLLSWKPARILTWSAWASSLWSGLVTAGVETRLLLNSVQEHALWCEVIQSGPALETLGSIDALADLAAGAWKLAVDHEAIDRLGRSGPALTQDARTFEAWAAVFRMHCRSRDYLTAAELAGALRIHVEGATLPSPAHLLLVGFEQELPAAHERLVAAFAKAGCTIQRHSPSVSSSVQLAVRCDHPEHEGRAAAHWMRNFIRARSSAGESARIALIVPQLEEERPALEAMLRDVLAPELQHIDADLSAGPVGFSAGLPLAEYSLIAVALDLIQWLAEPLDPQRVTALLLSPYIGRTEDLPGRAEFDAFQLRKAKRLRPELTLRQVLRLAEQKAAGTSAPTWCEEFQALAQRAAQVSPTTLRAYADWMELFRAALRDTNWPGDRPLTAREFDAARAWEHVLDSVATLDFAGNRVAFATALQAVIRQIRQVQSGAGARVNAAVEVMRPFEAAGTPFDAIVFVHATDALWPAPVRPNPLLSWPLQRELNMPGVQPSYATAGAAEVTAGLIAATPNILFFYPARSDAGEQRLSPVVAALGLENVSASELVSLPAQTDVLPTEVFADVESLPALPSDHVAGGARVLRLQAACAFLAAAELRLRSTTPEAAPLGVDNLESGNFVHRAMQAVWSELKSQQKLMEKSPEELDALIARSVRSAVSAPSDSSPWETAYLDVQRERLVKLIRSWLRFELERGRFEVLSAEEDSEVTIGPLTLSVRMDRVDTVDGGHVFVDYKTGAGVRHSHWDGARPEEPQLPLYALLSQPGELKGIAFARIRAGEEMSWVGRHSAAGVLPSKRIDDLDQAIEEWRETLAALAEDFAAGRSSVRPRSIAIDCAHCAQRLLCRIDPELFTAQSATDEPVEDAG